MRRPGKRERARAKNRRRFRMWTSANVTSAGFATGNDYGPFGRKHATRFWRWNAKRYAAGWAASVREAITPKVAVPGETAGL